MPYRGYNDEWILAHYAEYPTLKKLYERYREEFQFGTLKNFQNHCNSDLGLNRRYTTEEDAWIRQNYPRLGAKTAFEQFQSMFKTRHTVESFKSRVRDLGLHVTDKRWREACQNNGVRENTPVGTIKKRGRGGNFIKVAKGTEGWIPLPQYKLGKCNDGEIIIHLDGDKSNDSDDNLRVISRAVNGAMRGQNMYSTNRDITLAGVLCCELEYELGKMGVTCKFDED